MTVNHDARAVLTLADVVSETWQDGDCEGVGYAEFVAGETRLRIDTDTFHELGHPTKVMVQVCPHVDGMHP